MQKSAIRKSILNQWDQLSVEQRQQKSMQIQNSLLNLLAEEVGVWAGFKPLQSEPQIDFEKFTDQVWGYPKVTEEGLQFFKNVQNFSVSSLGVQEPIDGETVEFSQMCGVVVPALGYHKKGYRLGRGRGFYDRAFSQANLKKIGLCFDFAFSDKIPFEDHDLQVDYVVTDQQVYKIQKV